ncbi:MAG: hypothetical protein KC418_18295 [Anaerolineales bacterium]|nr:hypothetical protein [Anaerolineales bacterium]MCB8952098.1 hypothetical protein [Ardenticatenales bacterium]
MTLLTQWRTNKVQRRFWTVVKNAFNSLLLPIFNVVVSFLVIRRASVDLWGAFVNVMIVVQLAAHVVGWGNKEYLLRAFSQSPATIGRAWLSSLWTRLTLLALLSVAAWFWGFASGRTLLIIGWGLGQVLVQSYDVLVLYRRDFLYAAALELVGLAVMAGVVVWQGPATTLDTLLALFCGVHLAQAAAFAWRFRRDTFLAGGGRLDWGYYRLAFPFFLLGLSGMLQSRADLYAVNFYLMPAKVGQYQVFINLMLYAQSVSAFVLMPFVKTLYRLQTRAILKIAARLFALGLLLVGPFLLMAHLALVYLYQFQLPLLMLLLGGLFILPIYAYLPAIYALYKNNRQTAVVSVNVLGIAANFGLNMLLLPRVGMVGAIAASAAAQWLMLVVYGGWVRYEV